MYPNPPAMKKGRLLVGAAIGVTGCPGPGGRPGGRRCDVLALDLAHGHSYKISSNVKRIKALYPDACHCRATWPLQRHTR